jgi:hypothetical protein
MAQPFIIFRVFKATLLLDCYELIFVGQIMNIEFSVLFLIQCFTLNSRK